MPICPSTDNTSFTVTVWGISREQWEDALSFFPTYLNARHTYTHTHTHSLTAPTSFGPAFSGFTLFQFYRFPSLCLVMQLFINSRLLFVCPLLSPDNPHRACFYHGRPASTHSCPHGWTWRCYGTFYKCSWGWMRVDHSRKSLFALGQSLTASDATWVDFLPSQCHTRHCPVKYLFPWHSIVLQHPHTNQLCHSTHTFIHKYE